VEKGTGAILFGTIIALRASVGKSGRSLTGGGLLGGEGVGICLGKMMSAQQRTPLVAGMTTAPRKSRVLIFQFL
jgi:hypothetical protein